MKFEREMRTAACAAAAGCGVALRAKRLGLAHRALKRDGTPVTAADYAAQFIVARTISGDFPDDALVAEETPDDPEVAATALSLLEGADEREFSETLGRARSGAGAGRFWVIDPIDGTEGFVRGAQFAVAVALVEDGAAVAGALGCPGLGFVMSGARGLGVKKEPVAGAEVNPPEIPDGKWPVLCETARGNTGAYAATRKILQIAGGGGRTVKMDGQGKYALVADAAADLFIRVPNPGGRRENIWDHAAGVAVAQAAGVKVSDFDGGTVDFGSGLTLSRNRGVVAGRREAHERALGAIKEAEL